VSVRARLTLWYAATILAILVGSGLLLRATIRQTLIEEFDRGLSDTILTIRNVFGIDTETYGETEAAIAHMVEELAFTDRWVEFHRAGRIRYQTHAPGVDSPPALIPPTRTTSDVLDPHLAPDWTVHVVATASPLARTLRYLDRWLLLGVPLSVIAAALGGWWLTGRTLRPVRRMAVAAERITASEPGLRLPIDDPNDEIGRLGTRFNALLDRLEGLLAQQRRFTADAAHELRTPLARLRGAVELRVASPPDPEADREALARVLAELDRASAVVDELLQLARADAGERPHTLVEGFLDDVVLDTASAWHDLAADRAIELRIEVGDETPARFDPELIARLLGILIGNALRYTPAGGRVTLRARPEADGAVLEVEDTGIGIAPEERSRVFERFYRGRHARRLAPQGSGLGLAIAHWITEAHGGTIELDSPSEGGTLARVRLPARPRG